MTAAAPIGATGASVAKRVLIVSPNFPPINAPDHQRVRMSLPYVRQFGWEADVLAVEPQTNGGIYDGLLSTCIPDGVGVASAKAIPVRLTGPLGVRGLAWRSLFGLYSLGSRMLSGKRYDLMFFSTTMFPVLALGRLWQRRFHVPYVVDFQDPWLTDYYDRPGAPPPPGGHIKYRATALLGRILEPFSMRGASGLISVSPDYVSDLFARYGWLRSLPHMVLPFAGNEHDLEVARQPGAAQKIFDPADGRVHWVYAGVAGGVMAFALRSFFRALAAARAAEPDRYRKVVVHFIGTDYAPAARARKSVEALAGEYGVGDMVTERAERVPYFEALRCLLDAHALVVPGTDDGAYTASKIYAYILARKPLLAIFHERSGAAGTVRATSDGTVVTFETGDSVETVSERIGAAWFANEAWRREACVREAAFEQYTAREMTRRLCRYFDEVLSTNAS